MNRIVLRNDCIKFDQVAEGFNPSVKSQVLRLRAEKGVHNPCTLHKGLFWNRRFPRVRRDVRC